MKNAELNRMDIFLANAHSAEEIFGQLEGTQAEKLATARKIFLRLARIVHPDVSQDAEDLVRADLAFKRLAHFWEQAQAQLKDNSYGAANSAQSFKPFVVQSGKGQYMLERLLAQGDLCNLYYGNDARKQPILLKVPYKPLDNDLAANEVRILRHLHASAGYEKASAFISQLIDAFPYEERATGMVRQMTVLSYIDGLFSLKEVREAYPGGIDARDMAWIWRRVLVALDFAHTSAVIHGAVLPVHVLIHPQQHGVVLVDWSYAITDPARTHERISAISAAYRAWYPEEVFAREEPGPGLDIYMAASCMIDLLGGNPHEQILPDHVPWQIQNHLKGCMLTRPQQRPQDAGILLKEFDELLERLWGPRKFHMFSMHPR